MSAQEAIAVALPPITGGMGDMGVLDTFDGLGETVAMEKAKAGESEEREEVRDASKGGERVKSLVPKVRLWCRVSGRSCFAEDVVCRFR